MIEIFQPENVADFLAITGAYYQIIYMLILPMYSECKEEEEESVQLCTTKVKVGTQLKFTTNVIFYLNYISILI